MLDENEDIVCIGDYNFVETSLDRNTNKLSKSDHECKQIWDLISNKANLIDTFWVTNKTRRLYTFSSPTNFKSRDRIFVPVSWLGKVLSTTFENSEVSDHKIVKTKFSAFIEKGPGVYIFNNSLLNDPYFVQEVKSLINEYSESFVDFGCWTFLWDCLKMNIAEFSKEFSRQ